MSRDNCPSPGLLSAFAIGDLSVGRFESIHGHLESCSACQAQLAALDKADDRLVRDVRQLHETGSTAGLNSNGRANHRGTDSQQTRESLLSGARRRDPESWNRLCRLYEPLVTHWCSRLGVPPQDVPDVVQDVFSSVARGLHNFHKRKRGDSFRAWLRTVTRNRTMDWFRVNAGKATAAGGSVAWKRMSELPAESQVNEVDEMDERRAEVDRTIGQESDETVLHQRLLYEALQTVQGNCDENTWRAFWRVVVDGARAVDVAEELDLSAVSVRVAKCRVLNRLRRELGDVEF